MQSKPIEMVRNGSGPVFSVIVPLEYHRGRWEECLSGWQAQTLARECFEIIVVVPPDFPADLLAPFLTASTTALHAASSHDIALAAVGATRARGESLPKRIVGRSRTSSKNACKKSNASQTSRVSHAGRSELRTIVFPTPKPTCTTRISSSG